MRADRHVSSSSPAPQWLLVVSSSFAIIGFVLVYSQRPTTLSHAHISRGLVGSKSNGLIRIRSRPSAAQIPLLRHASILAGQAHGTRIATPAEGRSYRPPLLSAILVPIIGGMAWMTRPKRTWHADAAFVIAALDSAHTERPQPAAPAAGAPPTVAGPPIAEDAPAPPGLEELAMEVTAKEYAAHYAQNVVQTMVPITLQDKIPVISVVDIFKHGAVEMPLGRLHMHDIANVFTGGFQDVTGVPVFILLHRYMKVSPIYKLCIGPRSVVVISDAIAVKHILKSEVGKYDKGILAEVLKPIMGKGLIPADTLTWIARRRAIKPAFHQRWLNDQMELYSTVGGRLVNYLADHLGENIDMQDKFCSASLDIVGKAVFNYEFGSITRECPVIQAVYAVMREAERRASSIIPYWLLPGGTEEFDKHMHILDDVLTSLVEQCIRQLSEPDDDDAAPQADNNSLLRILVEARGQDVTTKQLRDDLMTMLIAGHETTAATLTWALHELSRPENAALLRQVRQQVDEVLGDRTSVTLEDVKQLSLVRYCLVEALRLYPAPPLLIRRCLKADHLTGVGPSFQSGFTIHAGQDVMLATWSMHRDKRLWGEDAEVYNPMRYFSPVAGDEEYRAAGWAGFDPTRVRGLYPDETAADFGFVPFGGGGRKCMGDQFAMLESTVLLSLALREFAFEAVSGVTLGMGATIFAKEGLMMRPTRRPVAQRAAAGSAPIAARGETPGPAGQCPIPPAAIASGPGCPVHSVASA